MKNILSIIACMVACFTFLSADEFFEAAATIGGYGELHWNKAYDDDGNETSSKLDFHRFIIYYGYNWTDKWSFKSELELEHNTVIPGDTDTDGADIDVTNTGELELEQAFVNYHSGNWGFQGGVILPSVGLLNEYHEPPVFLSVERPAYSKYIIPTTWFGNGFAFYGKLNDFNWRVALLEDLNGAGIVDGKNIRDGRAKGFKSTAFDWTKNFSASYTGINGLRLGGSFTMNNAPVDVSSNVNDSPDSYLAVSLLEVNVKYSANNVHTVFEFGNIDFKGTEIENFDDFKSSGYYFDLGYDLGSFTDCGKLIPWFRTSSVSTDTKGDSKGIRRLGLTWWPIDNVVFKADYGTVKKGTSEYKKINIGMGYNF